MNRHNSVTREKRSDEAIQSLREQTLDCFASLAMTNAPSFRSYGRAG
jgi:hypothetical protein